MALVRIQDLAAAGAITGAELVEIEQGGVSVQTTTGALAGATRAVVTALTPAAGVITLDWNLGDYFTVAPTANITSMVFTNLPASPAAITMSLLFTQDTTPRTLAFPAAFDWPGGTLGVVSTGSGDKDLIIFTSFNQGTTWLANIANDYA